VKRAFFIVVVSALVAAAIYGWQTRVAAPTPWSDEELSILRSLWIGNLPPLLADTGNAVADNVEAAQFGQLLFFDTRLSGNGGIACVTCHQPGRHFTDGLQKGQAIGTSRRNTRSIVGVAYSPWLYWDGRRDSLWSQALSPLEDPNEHGGDRENVAALIAADDDYRVIYEAVFGESPDPGNDDAVNVIFANVGKAIAAYERLLMPGPSRFDAYVESVIAGEVSKMFSNDEIRGLRLFIGEANCTQCHNGPLLTNHEFHNTGVLSYPGEAPDKGRVQGAREVLADPFNCRGSYSDDPAPVCAELEYARTGPELIGTMRTPSLRNLHNTAPYMHKGQLATLAEVLEHYNEAPLAMIGHNEAKPLGLSRHQLGQLEAFLATLAAPLATAEEWLTPPATRLDADDDQDQQDD
jgi:cytochrome c peroxidase